MSGVNVKYRLSAFRRYTLNCGIHTIGELSTDLNYGRFVDRVGVSLEHVLRF